MSTFTPTLTMYGPVRLCWIKCRGYARIPDCPPMRPAA